MRPLSARNPRVNALARLARRPGDRAEQRALCVEGPILLATAIEAGVEVIDVYVDETAAGRPVVIEALARLDPAVDPWVLPEGTLDRVGDVVTSQGVVAVVRWEEPTWPSVESTPFVLVLADVGDPGNAGTLIRAAAAAGAGAVVSAGGVDVTSPKVVRASAGALFGIDVMTSTAPDIALRSLSEAGYRIAGTVVSGGEPYDRVDLTGPVAVVVGNEARGLTPDLLDALDIRLTIPMAGPTESLNVAMAGTVVCFEVLRQRRG